MKKIHEFSEFVCMLFENNAELKDFLEGMVNVDGNDVQVVDADALRSRGIDRLIYNAVFHESLDLRDYLYWLIREAAADQVIYPASIAELYAAMARREVPDFTVPAVNIRILTYDTARAFFRAAHSVSAGALIFEIAKSEMGYTAQSPAEYATCILAAALREHHQGPVFIQGDHFQINAANFARTPDREFEGMRGLIDDAIAAGFFNIDIDTSTLVDLSQPDVDAQQAPNYVYGAELTAYIRSVEPKGISVAIGGEIGEVGKQNSTVEEFRAYMNGFQDSLRARNDQARGICKISVQSGTEHGGDPLPGGGVAPAKIDFDVLRDIGEVARREYGLGGSVQHGASTLPIDIFDRFPQNAVCEIHLATGFQNLVFDHEAFPVDLREELYGWIDQSLEEERKEGQTEEQFYYKARKRALGPFKRRFWDMDEDALHAILRSIEGSFAAYLEKLGVKNTVGLVRDTISIHRVVLPAPVSGYDRSAETTLDYILSDTGGE